MTKSNRSRVEGNIRTAHGQNTRRQVQSAAATGSGRVGGHRLSKGVMRAVVHPTCGKSAAEAANSGTHFQPNPRHNSGEGDGRRMDAFVQELMRKVERYERTGTWSGRTRRTTRPLGATAVVVR